MLRTDSISMRRPWILFLSFAIVLGFSVHGAVPHGLALDVPLTVKENADVGVNAYPVSAVIPLPRGKFTDPQALGLKGRPSQVEVLERWPEDQSLRHVLAHFQTGAGAHQNTTHRFTTPATPTQPAEPVQLEESSDAITVDTGPLKFRVSKTAFNLLDEVWFDDDGNRIFDAGEQMILSHGRNGGVFTPRDGAGTVQYDAKRERPQVTVEERGPMRAVIRVEAPAEFFSVTDHVHGFAVRIYAYAGKPFIKIDYQLQNSARNAVRSWPLYFEALDIDFRLNFATNATLRFGRGGGNVLTMPLEGGAVIAQEMHNHFRILALNDATVLYDSGIMKDGTGPEGFVDVSNTRHGVMAAVRNFWQMWPNGLAVNGAGKLSLQLFPHWSAQWHQGAFSPSGLYWLEDMQHVIKEILLHFHGPNIPDAALVKQALTFQFPPTVMVPTDWYRRCRATLDLGGVVPPAAAIPAVPDRRRPTYRTEGFNPEDWYDQTGPYYGAGWVNFYDPEPGYRSVACTPGGWPYSGAHAVATGNPADYFESEAHGQSELNLRPEWMARYRHDRDWPRLLLSENPYCGGRWRIFEGNGISKLAAPPLPNTGEEEPVFYARDDQHGWFYHVAEAYFMTGNPWIRDWYKFIAQFRRVRLENLDPFPENNSRATGHALHHVLQAYRIAEDTSLLSRFGEYLRTTLRPHQDPYYGDQLGTVEEGGGGFQTGYLMRTLITYLEEVQARGGHQAYAEGFNYLSGLMEWNYNYGNFPYYFDARNGGKGVSSGTALTLVDPQAWYYWHTGKQKYLNQLKQYMTSGINGGEQPYGQFNEWTGQFEGRWYLHVRHTPRQDKTPPPAVANLKAARTSPSTVRLRWTAPAGAARYHIVWSHKPIVEENSTDVSVSNWWAANAVGPALKPVSGAQQSITIEADSAGTVYAALFTFDHAGNMSSMSNVAEAASP